MPVGPNPILPRQLRTDQQLFVNLTGLRDPLAPIKWIDLYVFAFGPYWDDFQRDGAYVIVEGSIDNSNWRELFNLGYFAHQTQACLRNWNNYRVFENPPPYMRIKILKLNEPGRETFPYELLIQQYSG